MTLATADLLADGRLTEGMARDLKRYREWEAKTGTPPTPREWAKTYRMSGPAADAALIRLAAGHFIGPRRAYRLDERGTGPAPAELQCRRLIELLRQADAILRTIAVNDRPARDEWRLQAAEYLLRPETP